MHAEIIIIPTEEGDIIGHADGMVRFIDNKTVLVNDYKNSSVAFQKKIYKILEAKNLNIVLLPYTPDDKWLPKNKYDVAPATGVYVNYLQTGDTVIAPQFMMDEDSAVLDILSHHFKKVIPLNCQELATHGGVLNCISWN